MSSPVLHETKQDTVSCSGITSNNDGQKTYAGNLSQSKKVDSSLVSKAMSRIQPLTPVAYDLGVSSLSRELMLNSRCQVNEPPVRHNEVRAQPP